MILEATEWVKWTADEEKNKKQGLRTERYILSDWLEFCICFRNSGETSREKSWSQLRPRWKQKAGLLHRRHECARSGLLRHRPAPHSGSAAHRLRALVPHSLYFSLF